MSKKKILIINKSFELGGIQMALANMLAAIHDRYDITLAVFNKNGPLKDRIPKDVKILSFSPLVEALGMTHADCKEHGSIMQRLFKTIGSVWAKVFDNTLPVKFAFAFQKPIVDFDVVISYHQETSAHTLVTGFGKFALEKCTAPRKIAWVHADFIATGLGTASNYETYKQFDKIVCVSQTCANSFLTAYPALKEKTDYCYNHVPVEAVVEKASQMRNVFDRSKDATILFSACRLTKEKGLLPALENLLPLWEQGSAITWYIAGDGPERPTLEAFIHENHLESRVILLGFLNNPYPYMKEADYLFLPSLHETYSMVVSEAHILGTPVIASDIPIMREVLNEADILCPLANFIAKIKTLSCSIDSTTAYDTADAWISQFERLLT